ncbi:energy transducer TonB, partial [Aquicoccus porphyridii]
ADAAGSAAASNYPGLVMRRLSRAGRPRVNARGEAVVGFTIADNGGLAALGIARSSGSAALDRAALGIVRGAAPFPKPPRGAERRFSIRIRGR